MTSNDINDMMLYGERINICLLYTSDAADE